jgi:hypothetical protein
MLLTKEISKNAAEFKNCILWIAVESPIATRFWQFQMVADEHAHNASFTRGRHGRARFS